MSNIVKKKQYDFVNLAKFISAVFVIGIHTSPLQGLHPKLNYFTRCIVFRLAVPFFFICSGYFLAEKLFDEDKKKVKDYVKKYILNILNIYILWSIIYTLLNFNTYFGDGNIIKNIILVVARFLFKGAYIQLWYLSAICVSVYLIYKIHMAVKCVIHEIFLSQSSKIVPVKTASLRYAVCGCCSCIKNANCYNQKLIFIK